jgi:Myotubularin-related.
MGAYKQLNTYAFPGRKNLGFLFAFESRRDEVLASVQKIDGDNTGIGRITSRATCRRYDALTEFHRMVATFPDIQCPWRPLLNVNATYSTCQSYPSIVFGPSTINDETAEGMRILRDIASFRSGQRFQTLSWASRYDGASLWRCAQPKVGLQGNRNASDELYIKMIGECAALANSQALVSGKFPPRPSIEFLRMLTGGNNSSDFMLESFDRPGGAAFNEKCMVKILDLRPKSSAMANRTAGKCKLRSVI